MWNQLTSCEHEKQINSNDNQYEHAPILLSDPLAPLILIILTISSKLTRKMFERIANAVFNLVYIQNIVNLMMKSKFSTSNLDLNSEIKSFADYIHFISTITRFHTGADTSTVEVKSLIR